MGAAYQSGNLAASGGQPPYQWSLAAGPLPGGLSLNGNTVAGTPTTTGTYSVTLRVTDANNLTASRQYSITIYPTLLITTASPLAPGQTTGVYNLQLAAQGGVGSPYTWTLTSG